MPVTQGRAPVVRCTETARCLAVVPAGQAALSLGEEEQIKVFAERATVMGMDSPDSFAVIFRRFPQGGVGVAPGLRTSGHPATGNDRNNEARGYDDRWSTSTHWTSSPSWGVGQYAGQVTLTR